MLTTSGLLLSSSEWLSSSSIQRISVRGSVCISPQTTEKGGPCALVFVNSGGVILPCHQWCIYSLSWGTSLWEPPLPRRWTTPLWPGVGLGTGQAGRCLVWTGHPSPGGGTRGGLQIGKRRKWKTYVSTVCDSEPTKRAWWWAQQNRDHSFTRKSMWRGSNLSHFIK